MPFRLTSEMRSDTMSMRARLRAAVPAFDNDAGDEVLAAIERANALATVERARAGEDVSCDDLTNSLIASGDLDVRHSAEGDGRSDTVRRTARAGWLATRPATD